MKVLVTGGLGFLGRALCARLLERGDQIHIVDDLSSATVGPDFFAGAPHIQMAVEDIVNFKPKERFDMVFHLAGPVGSVGVLAHAGKIGKMILDQTDAVLELCAWAGAALVYVSSSEVYGRADDNGEEDGCYVPAVNSPRLAYGLGKRLAEVAVANRMSAENLAFQIIRPFNIAGPGQNHKAGFVIPTFFHQALAGLPLTVFGDGRQRRAFGHVRDVVDGILLAALRPPFNQVYNLGNPQNLTSIVDLARAVLTLTGSSSPLHFVDPKELHGEAFEESFEKVPCATKAQRQLNWFPRYNLNRILTDVWAHLPAMAGG